MSFLSSLIVTKKKKIKTGFSLLELLVVISIIGILIAIGAAAFTAAQQRGRDARRMGDMKAWQNALEQYFAVNTSYGSGSCGEAVTDYMTGTPDDPKGSGTYVYAANCDADSYCICAQLEAGSGNSTATSTSADSCSYGSGDFYCLSNLQ